MDDPTHAAIYLSTLSEGILKDSHPIRRESHFVSLHNLGVEQDERDSLNRRTAFLKRLGKHIAQVRKEQGYSQDRVYLEAGFSRGTLSKIERGIVNPQIWTLQVIAKTIGVPLRRLVTLKRK